MKFLHLSDLHFGKKVNGFSMAEEQEYIIDRIKEIVKAEAPQAVVLAGDIYDKPVPPLEAIKLCDKFLCGLSGCGVKVLAISGNHDSAERLAFAAGLLKDSGIFIAPAYSGELSRVELCDEFGEVNFYLMPFVKPVHVARAWPEDGVEDYTSAVRIALSHADIDFEKRNVLVAHQFVTGATRSESEELSVGGADNVDGSVFNGFDYVALGHIHGPQNVQPNVRYCGTPIKYSFSESSHIKSVTVVEMGKKGEVNVRTVPLAPMRNWVQLSGTYAQVTLKSYYEKLNANDYFKITLTDEEDIPEGFARLRHFYPNLMALEYDNARTRAGGDVSGGGNVAEKSPFELFSEFYSRQNGRELSGDMQGVMAQIIEDIWEDEK